MIIKIYFTEETDMANVISVILIVLIVVMSLKNLTNGFCLFLMTRVLVPEDVRFPIGNLSLNTAIILVLFFMTLINGFCNNEKIKYNRKFMLAVASFFVYAVFSLILSEYSNFEYQIGYVLQFFITDIMPGILAICILKRKKDILTVVKVFLVTCIIVGIYGIFSYCIQSNPYRMLWSSVSSTLTEKYWYGNYTTSTFTSTNALGYFIGLSFPFVAFLLNKKIYKNYSQIALVLLAIGAVLGKKRTTIVVLCCYFLMWFISGNIKKRFKYLVFSIPIIIGFLVAIFTIPSLGSLKNMLITSIFFWDDSTYNAVTLGNGGSTMALRVRQLMYPFTEIKDNIIFGHGIGWCSWYLSRGVIHPMLFGFESLPSQAICEFGIFSFIIYPLIFVGLYKFGDKKTKDKYVLLFVITSIIQMVATGQVYWYLELVMIILMRLVNEKQKFGGKKDATNYIDYNAGI